MKNSKKPWLPDPEIWKGTWRDDWRIMGQEGYLLQKRLEYIQFNRSICFEDNDQCNFCWDRFDEDPNCVKFAYFEPITKVWICEDCFNDFNEHFNWIVDDVNK